MRNPAVDVYFRIRILGFLTLYQGRLMREERLKPSHQFTMEDGGKTNANIARNWRRRLRCVHDARTRDGK